MINGKIDWNNKEQVLNIVTSNGEQLEFADSELKNDKEVVLAAVTGYPGGRGRALKYASESLKNDREIVAAAVVSRGTALEFASNELKSDIEIVSLAIKDDGWAIRYAHSQFRNNQQIALIALAHQKHGDTGIFLKLFSKELLQDIGFLNLAHRIKPDILHYISTDKLETLGFTTLDRPVQKLYFLIPVKSLFPPEEVDEWRHYVFKDRCLLLSCRLWMGVGGVEGEMGLWIPPSGHDELDAWEASRLAGKHDWWRFLNFLSSPKGGAYENQEITIFFAKNTFFDQNLRVLSRISESDDIFYGIENDFESLNQGVQVVIKLFEKHLDAKVIDSIE